MSTLIAIKIEHAEPVELVGFTGSLQALAKRWTRERKAAGDPVEEELKLYVRQIREGSIIIDLTTLAAHASVPLGAVASMVAADPAKAVEFANGAAEFVGRLKKVTDYFLKRAPKPENLSVRDCDDAHAIAAPIVSQSAGGLSITTGDNSPVNVSLVFNPLEANTIQNRARAEREALKEPAQNQLVDALFVWHQADVTGGRDRGSSPDKGIIEAISDKPVSALFPDPALKRQMIEVEDNPFAVFWLVDADVLTVNGRVTGYKITAIKGRGELAA